MITTENAMYCRKHMHKMIVATNLYLPSKWGNTTKCLQLYFLLYNAAFCHDLSIFFLALAKNNKWTHQRVAFISFN